MHHDIIMIVIVAVLQVYASLSLSALTVYFELHFPL